MALITLTTDFGLADSYVGAMKGVILGIAPGAAVVDISHAVPPQDLRAAAWVLYTAYHAFPAGTIHCVVVDPGVGSRRRAIAVGAGDYIFVAPDNGVLSYVLAQEPLHIAVELTNPHYHRQPVSHTFHGRDIFAPAAAYIAQGTSPVELGTPVGGLVTWPLSRPERRSESSLEGHILHIDRFGNCVSDLRISSEGNVWVLINAPGEGSERSVIARHRVQVTVGGVALSGGSRTYADGAPGELLALVGSSGHLEIACVGCSAARVLGLAVGDALTVDFEAG